MKQYNPIPLSPATDEVIGGVAPSIDVSAPIDTSSDPLSDDSLDSVDISFPVLQACHHNFRVETAVPDKDQDGVDRVKVTLVTTGQLMSTKNKLLPAGSKFNTNIATNPKGKRTEEMCKAEMKRWILAAQLPIKKFSDFKNNPGLLQGKVVPINVKVRKETDEYSESNNFNPIVKD